MKIQKSRLTESAEIINISEFRSDEYGADILFQVRSKHKGLDIISLSLTPRTTSCTEFPAIYQNISGIICVFTTRTQLTSHHIGSVVMLVFLSLRCWSLQSLYSS